jgi:hypothetical protein
MKDIFEKISDFFKAETGPDERPGQAVKQKDDGVGEGVAENKRKSAEGAEIQDAAANSHDIHKNSLTAFAQGESEQKKSKAGDQPEKEVRDGRNRFRSRSAADDAEKII